MNYVPTSQCQSQASHSFLNFDHILASTNDQVVGLLSQSPCVASSPDPIEIDYKSVGKTIMTMLNSKQLEEELKDEQKKDVVNYVIMGSSGVGKSSTINNLIEDVRVDGKPLRAEVGHTGDSLTKDITPFRGTFLGRPCNLFDTPGFQDSHGLKDEFIMSMIMQKICCDTQTKQIDGFILVDSMQADRIYSELYIKRIETIFGKDALRKIVVLTTKGENDLLSVDEDSQKEYHVKKNEIATKIANLGVQNQPITWSNHKNLGPRIWGLKKGDLNYLNIQRLLVYSIFTSLGGPIESTQIDKVQNIYVDFEASVRKQIGITESFVEITGPECPTKWHESYEYKEYDPSVGTILASIFTLGIAAAFGINKKTIEVPSWTEYIATTEEITASIPMITGQNNTCQNITGVRYEKIGGDGSLKSHVIDYEHGKIIAKLTTTNSKPVRYRFYATVQTLSTDIDLKLRMMSRECISNVLIKEKGHTVEYRKPDEISEAAQQYLKTRCTDDIEALINAFRKTI